MKIRDFREGDAKAVARVFYESIRGAGPRHYSVEQTEAWAPKPPNPGWFTERSQDGRVFLVAENEAGEVVCYGDLEPDGHIDHLFCRPDALGTGTAGAVVDRLLEVARERRMGRLYVEASAAARGLFERKGFTVIERRDFEKRGVPMFHFRMEKLLLRPPDSNVV